MARSAAPQRRLPLWGLALINLLAALLVIGLLQAFVVKVFTVPSSSMQPTLSPGDRLVVSRLTAGSPPSVGDVIVFRAQGPWLREVPGEEGPLRSAVKTFGDLTGIGPSHSSYLVKRVIATPGDTVECCDARGSLIRNGQPVNEDYLGAQPGIALEASGCNGAAGRCFGPLTVPTGQYFVLGDNRGNSSDSLGRCDPAERGGQQPCLRFVDREDIVGPLWFSF